MEDLIMADYIVQSTAPTVYLDKSGKAVSGFIVYIYLPDFDELHNLNVATLATPTVKAAADALFKDRKALANLGNSKA
jgi:hypothetical protein